MNKILFFGLLAQLYGAKFVLGVDIDNTLIQAAWRRRRAVWSTQGPTPPNPCTDQCDEEMVSDSQQRTQPNYFPASCEHEFSFLPIPPAENRGKEIFPHNISFRTADWVKTNIPEDKEGYDVVVGFVKLLSVSSSWWFYMIRILQVFHLEMDTYQWWWWRSEDVLPTRVRGVGTWGGIRVWTTTMGFVCESEKDEPEIQGEREWCSIETWKL